MTKILAWLVLIPVAALVAAFAVSNRQAMTLDFWPLPFEIETPVYLAILSAALLGFLAGGLITWLAGLRRTHRKVTRVKVRAAEERQAMRARLEEESVVEGNAATPAVVRETPQT